MGRKLYIATLVRYWEPRPAVVYRGDRYTGAGVRIRGALVKRNRVPPVVVSHMPLAKLKALLWQRAGKKSSHSVL